LIAERRRARRAAMQALFEVDQAGHDPDSTLDYWSKEEDLKQSGRAFAGTLLSGVLSNKATIDETIQTAAPAWPIAQVAPSDRVALEIGVYELTIAHEPPVEVAINEAVELAKTFGGANSAGFVNGVLRTIAERSAAHSHA
jgi:transcription antitermination protein NusB